MDILSLLGIIIGFLIGYGLDRRIEAILKDKSNERE